MICPRCQELTPDDSKFCNQCGTALSLVCESCSTVNTVGSRFCSQCGRPLLTGGLPSAGERGLARSPILGDEQRRPVTVVFADIVGFTALSERLDPEEVRDVTAACFGRLVEEIVRRGGTVDKFIGDAVMALFGTPVAHEDDAVRAVDAALAMQATLGEINGELERDHGLRLELRIGVNTGEVVAGVREVGGFHDATVIGDTVNTASRLQTAAPPSSVLVGEMTARLARHLFELEPTLPLTLKGKAEPVQAYRALGPLTTVPLADAATLPIVGRADELTALAARLDRLEAGEGGIVVVTGEPGAGKSRLLAEMKRMVDARPSLRMAEAHATPYGPGQTVLMYAPWAWAFFGYELIDLAAARAVDAQAGSIDDGPDSLGVRTVNRLRARLDGLGVPEALPFLCFLLELPRPAIHADLEDLSQEELHRRSLRAVRKLHRQLAAEGPCVVLMDDLHWAGPTILNFLEAAGELSVESPLLLVLSFRSDVDAPSWALREHARRVAGDRYVELALQPLAQAETRLLARALLGGAALDAQAEKLLLSRIDGNPLYAFQMIQTLVDRGALVVRDRQVILDAEAAQRIPESLQATILARIDRLPEEARRVVQTGAVLGRTFSGQLLTRVFGDGPALERGVREAIKAGVLVERPNPVLPGYTFTQSLVQEVAERTLLLRRRRELHRLTLDAIEALYPDELSAHAEGLTRHAMEAEAWEAGARYALLAAERASAGYSTREALRHYDLGLEAAERLAEEASPLIRCELLAGRGRMLWNIGQVDESAAAFQAAFDVARASAFAEEALAANRLDPRRWQARLALQAATIFLQQLDIDAASATVDAAFGVLNDTHPELASAWALRSSVLMHRNQTADAAQAARTALRLALATGGFEERSRAYSALTKPGLAGEIGPDIARYAQEAIRLAREHGQDFVLFEALISAEVLRQICLQPHTPDALAHAQEALDLALKMDSVVAEGCARIILGAANMTGGHWDDAERELTSDVAVQCAITAAAMMRGIVLARLLSARGKLDAAGAVLAALDEHSYPHGDVWFLTSVMVYRLAAGDVGGARRAVAEATAAQDRIGCLTCEGMLGGMGSEVLAAIGDREQALALAARADHAGEGAYLAGRLMAARARVNVALDLGDWETAIVTATDALPLAEGVGQPFESARLLQLLGTAYAWRARAGDTVQAQGLLRDAAALFESMGARPSLEATLAELGRLDGAASEKTALPST
ncbi:MAG: AAA family ATPase [Chloroflexi bacterium]|nr:AAA family ATPase [Chloroflexota bacterium]